LTDERYGPVGHPDANWLQLEQAGFGLQGARLVPVLTGQERSATAAQFDQVLATLFAEHDLKIGLFGIGADGHIAGALPGSPAVGNPNLVADYEAGPFERITITPRAIAQLDEAVVYVMGEAKWPILDQLDISLPLDEQPAQVLKSLPTVTVYNDYKGESV
jgi:6-phosphogluconolactonase/glucosamine-6-phosphate isomerase/deaminase